MYDIRDNKPPESTTSMVNVLETIQVTTCVAATSYPESYPRS